LCDIEEGIPLAGTATSTTCKECLINNCSDEALTCANASTNTCKTVATVLLTCLQNDAECSITALTNQ
jgi:hypothetical protein